MEKTSREYAEKLAKKHCNIKESLVIDSEERYYKDFQKYDGFVEGYLKAVEETNVKELRDVCKKLKTALEFGDTIENAGQIKELLKIANSALNKTKS